MLSAFRRLSAGAWGSERGGDCPLAGARACGPRGLFGPPGPQGGEGAGGRRSGRCLPLWPGKRLPDPGPVSRSGKRRFTETTCGRAQPGARAREGRGKGSCRGSCPSGLWRVGGRERGPEGPCGSSAATPPQGTWAVRPWTLGRGRGAVWLLHQRREGSCLVPQQGRRCLRPQACCSCLASPKVSRPQGGRGQAAVPCHLEGYWNWPPVAKRWPLLSPQGSGSLGALPWPWGRTWEGGL